MSASILTCFLKLKHTINAKHKLLCFSGQPFYRFYRRSLRRKPKGIRSQEDDLNAMESQGLKLKNPKQNPFISYVPGDPTQEQVIAKQPTVYQQSFRRTLKKVSSNKHLPTEYFLDSGLRYEKLEDGDKRFGQIIMKAKSRKEREKQNVILLEGRRLILDALQNGAHLKHLYFNDLTSVSNIPPKLLGDAELYKVQYRHLKLWSDTVAPVGILGVFTRPKLGEILQPQTEGFPITLICDRMSDPGNMGTIIRTAAAVGCSTIITTKGSVDVWEPKVLRSGMGAHFYTSILSSLTWEQIATHIPTSSCLYIADSRKITNVEKSFDFNSKQVLSLVDTNTANDSDSDDDTESSDGGSDMESEEEGEKGGWSQRACALYNRAPMTLMPYTDIKCSDAENVTVIIGGETMGVSTAAQKFAFERFGCYVTIPMVQAADSLNSAAAAAVILYEIRKQLASRTT